MVTLATPFVRLLTRRDECCVVRVTETLSEASAVLKAVTEDWTEGDNETDVDLRGRVGAPTPPTPIIALFLAFLSGDACDRNGAATTPRASAHSPLPSGQTVGRRRGVPRRPAGVRILTSRNVA